MQVQKVVHQWYRTDMTSGHTHSYINGLVQLLVAFLLLLHH